MKAKHSVFVLLVTGFIVSCGSIYGVEYDYDLKADFDRLKTYGWMAVPDKADIESLDVERVKKAVNNGLKAKGLKMDSNNPDFLIAEHLGTKDKVQITNWGYGYGPHRGYWGGYWGPGGITAYQYEEGSLILDFVDANTKKMIWRGVAKADVNNANTPQKKEKLINEAVQEILKNFPPKQSE